MKGHPENIVHGLVVICLPIMYHGVLQE